MNPEVREKIEALFLKNGLRMTKPRQVILEAAFSDQGDHFTAEELFEKARKLIPRPHWRPCTERSASWSRVDFYMKSIWAKESPHTILTLLKALITTILSVSIAQR